MSSTSAEAEAEEEMSTLLAASTVQSVLEGRPSAATMRATLQKTSCHLPVCVALE